MDEFHYYGDVDRGMAWQLPLLMMPNARFLLMSATLGDTKTIERDLTARTGMDVAVVKGMERPVPLVFEYSQTPLHSALDRLVRRGSAPVYAVEFTQRGAAELAASLLSTDHVDKDRKAALKAALKGVRFDSPFGPLLRRMLLHGVGLHHAGLLPRYRLAVERLAVKGLLAVICGTDTLGVGINVPIRTVLFTALCKYDGTGVDILSVRDFQQIAGRAGRKGFDVEGLVVAQAPAWVIENNRLADAVASGKRNKKKFVRKKAPTKGYKHWDEATFERLQNRQPSALRSRFKVDHGLVLALLQKAEETGEDGMTELFALIDMSHDGPTARGRNRQTAIRLLDELGAAGVVDAEGRVAVELQRDFSLHHSLSLFLLHAVERLDRESATYALDVVGLVEAILEHPRVILGAQVNREKGRIIAELKQQGVPYEERMEALEKVTWPKPNAEWIYATYEAYSDDRPWLQGEYIRPKAIARELIESCASFGGTIKDLRLERAEGVVLRYLTQVYKTLIQNVPADARTDELEGAIAALRTVLARADDSLLAEWTRRVEGEDELPVVDAPIDISADERAFRARVRADLHAIVRALALGDYTEAAAMVRRDDEAWSAADFEQAIGPYIEEYGQVVFDGRARQAWNTVLQADGGHLWVVKQVLVDDEEDNAWSIDGVVDLRADTNPQGPIVRVVAIGE
jgi:superfamily II RNA helicase